MVLVLFEKSQLLLYYYYYYLNLQSHNLHDDFIVVNYLQVQLSIWLDFFNIEEGFVVK